MCIRDRLNTQANVSFSDTTVLQSDALCNSASGGVKMSKTANFAVTTLSLSADDLYFVLVLLTCTLYIVL